MNLPFFISKKINESSPDSNRLSRPVIGIATGGIILGMTAMILTIFIVKGFQKEVRERAVAFNGHIQVVKNGTNNSSETNPIDMNSKSIEALKSIDNISFIQHFVTKNGIIKTKTENEGIILKGVGKKYNWGFIGSHITEGQILNPDEDSSKLNVMISKVTSERLGLKCGDPVFIYFILTDSLIKISNGSKDSIVDINSQFMTDFRYIQETLRPDTSLIIKYRSKVKKFSVKGIYETGMEEFDKKIVFTTEEELKKICGWNKNETGAFEIYIQEFNKLDETSDIVSEYLKGDFSLSSYSIKETNPGIFEWLDMHDTTAWLIIVLMIVVAVINMVSALIILIIEKIKMIGLLKAMGMQTGKIIRIFLYQASRIILKGILWGNFLGLSLAFFQDKTHFFTLDQSTYYMPFIPINFEWTYLIFLNTGTFLTCMIFMLFPCLIIAKTSPIRAIRFD